MAPASEQSGSLPPAERLVAGEDAGGMRLDAYLARRLPTWSRVRLQAWIREGRVLVDGGTAAAARRLRGGETIDVQPPALKPATLEPASIPLEVVYNDPDLMVVVKPAGMVVHPGAGTHEPTLVHALLGLGMPLSGIGGEERPGIVHRLDRDTSGLLVVACSDLAHRRLSDAFKERRVRKEYRAACWGAPTPKRGTIDLPIGRDPVNRRTMSPRGRRLREARTLYRVLESYPGFSYLEILLETGRTHQIRAHLRSLGHPVVGDRAYGGAGWRRVRRDDLRETLRTFDRLALHARQLSFDHPLTGEPMEFTAEIPEKFAALLECMRGTEAAP
jgi:23S rRNA pseudouridine1911/1915/1917 synthase